MGTVYSIYICLLSTVSTHIYYLHCLHSIYDICRWCAVVPHCSAPVRLNHLARCTPLKAPASASRSRGREESFEALFHDLSRYTAVVVSAVFVTSLPPPSLALAHHNQQRPLPSPGQLPALPRRGRRTKPRRLSSARQSRAPAPAPAQQPGDPSTCNTDTTLSVSRLVL